MWALILYNLATSNDFQSLSLVLLKKNFPKFGYSKATHECWVLYPNVIRHIKASWTRLGMTALGNHPALDPNRDWWPNISFPALTAIVLWASRTGCLPLSTNSFSGAFLHADTRNPKGRPQSLWACHSASSSCHMWDKSLLWRMVLQEKGVWLLPSHIFLGAEICDDDSRRHLRWR